MAKTAPNRSGTASFVVASNELELAREELWPLIQEVAMAWSEDDPTQADRIAHQAQESISKTEKRLEEARRALEEFRKVRSQERSRGTSNS